MTYCKDSGRFRTDYFVADLEEYEGRTPEDAATTEIAVRNAVETIGTLMREDRKRRQREGLPDLALPEEMAAELAAEQAAQRPRRGASRKMAGMPGLMKRLRGFRPGPVHALWAVAFGAMYLWPKAVLIALFAGFVICLVGVALFGPEILERLRSEAQRRLSGLVRRRPVRHQEEADALFDDLPDPFERLRDERG